MGTPELNLPSNPDAALKIQISLFRRMAKGTIHPALFAHAYLSLDRNLDVNVRELSHQLFSPIARELRRHLVKANPLQERPKSVFSVKPGPWGIHLDLKELGRRVAKLWRRA